jgi:hypothetical protein
VTQRQKEFTGWYKTASIHHRAWTTVPGPDKRIARNLAKLGYFEVKEQPWGVGVRITAEGSAAYRG